MNRLALTALVGVLGVGMLVASPDTAVAQQKAPPGGAYKNVSALVSLPDFVPGLGTLYVDPATLPAGPFLAYDHQGDLVSSIYMIPLTGDLQTAERLLGVHVLERDHVDGAPQGERLRAVDVPRCHAMIAHAALTRRA